MGETFDAYVDRERISFKGGWLGSSLAVALGPIEGGRPWVFFSHGGTVHAVRREVAEATTTLGGAFFTAGKVRGLFWLAPYLYVSADHGFAAVQWSSPAAAPRLVGAHRCEGLAGRACVVARDGLPGSPRRAFVPTSAGYEVLDLDATGGPVRVVLHRATAGWTAYSKALVVGDRLWVAHGAVIESASLEDLFNAVDTPLVFRPEGAFDAAIQDFAVDGDLVVAVTGANVIARRPQGASPVWACLPYAGDLSPAPLYYTVAVRGDRVFAATRVVMEKVSLPATRSEKLVSPSAVEVKRVKDDVDPLTLEHQYTCSLWPEDPWDMKVTPDGLTLCIAGDDQPFSLVDVPATWRAFDHAAVAATPLGNSPVFSVATLGARVYAADFNSGLTKFDVSPTHEPTSVETFFRHDHRLQRPYVEASGRHVAVGGSPKKRAFASRGDEGVFVFTAGSVVRALGRMILAPEPGVDPEAPGVGPEAPGRGGWAWRWALGGLREPSRFAAAIAVNDRRLFALVQELRPLLAANGDVTGFDNYWSVLVSPIDRPQEVAARAFPQGERGTPREIRLMGAQLFIGARHVYVADASAPASMERAELLDPVAGDEEAVVALDAHGGYLAIVRELKYAPGVPVDHRVQVFHWDGSAGAPVATFVVHDEWVVTIDDNGVEQRRLRWGSPGRLRVDWPYVLVGCEDGLRIFRVGRGSADVPDAHFITGSPVRGLDVIRRTGKRVLLAVAGVDLGVMLLEWQRG